jgi:hypothetical protein
LDHAVTARGNFAEAGALVGVDGVAVVTLFYTELLEAIAASSNVAAVETAVAVVGVGVVTRVKRVRVTGEGDLVVDVTIATHVPTASAGTAVRVVVVGVVALLVICVAGDAIGTIRVDLSVTTATFSI